MQVVSPKLLNSSKKKSIIRELYEYGLKRAEEIGKENVYDFSLGNPSVHSPDIIKEKIKLLLENSDSFIHLYTSSQGAYSVREKIAIDLNNKYSTSFNANNLFMTCGASAALAITLRTLTYNKNDEFIVIAPFFPEYKTYVQSAGSKLVIVPPDEDFQINFEILNQKITRHTKGIIINSPNNPSGTVYTEETIKRLAELLKQKMRENNNIIYIISDEVYREIVYDDTQVPFITNYYDNTIVCYSFSKTLSLPGGRIGYILIPDKAYKKDDIYDALLKVAGSCGYACAPSLYQYLIGEVIGTTVDINLYKKNRDFLYEELIKLGFKCVYPKGGFYLLVKALEEDDVEFCENAKQEDILVVPTKDFGCPGYVRIAYCVTYEKIERSIPAFKKLKEKYN